ncbi:MAG: transglutaminase domain-containing protein [Chitinophagales bacterium]|nr:transglutaminase domain-containing protein [Chitinophagales bacterium]
MKTINFLSLICFCLFTSNVFTQNSTNQFEKLLEKQDSLMLDAYYKKDTKLYNKALKDLLNEYDKLSKNDQKFYLEDIGGSYYNFACLYSLINDKPMALKYLQMSIDNGYIDYTNIQEDTDLDNIRNEAEFTKIITQLKSVGDYLYILKNASEYNNEDNRSLPKFTYQSKDDSNLVALRKAFNLDSIAGNGTDVLQVLNLLHWIHDLIPHDGSKGSPIIKNAVSMITECKKENRTLNCRGLATVLNECYLAMGFASRLVTGLPKDSLKIDMDCHVINAVFIKSLNKWVWIDPTFDAFVMDENGNLLSIEEVRERIINNQPLILNPDANWNRSTAQTKEHYLYEYMAKNLYMIECPASSEYNMETRINNKTYDYIKLVPLDYFEQVNKTENHEKNTNTTFIKYNTNNAKLFWQAP